MECIRIYMCYKSTGFSDISETFSTYLIKSTLGNYGGYSLFDGMADIYVMTIVPAAIYAIFFIFYLCWKKHYNDCIDEEEEDKEFIKPEKFCVEVEGF